MHHPMFLFAIGLLTVTISIVPLGLLAARVGLVDVPTDRKRHVGLVPLVGGIAILICILVWLPSLGLLSEIGLAMITLCPMVLVLGIVDDKVDLSARLRFGVQLLVGAMLALAFGVRIEMLDGLVSADPIVLTGAFSIAFTIVCVTGVLNATNMTDGVDGLLGSVSASSLAAIAALAAFSGHGVGAGIATLVAGAIAGYLLFNFGVFGERRKVFLGDSGSMVLGLVLVILLIALSQGDRPAFSPTAAGWLLGLPLLDTVTVMVRRLFERRSPFSAGRDHVHHLLLDIGYTPRRTVVTLVGVHLAMLTVGVLVDASGLPSWLFFWAFVALSLGHFFFTPRLAARTVGVAKAASDRERAVARSGRRSDLESNVPVALPRLEQERADAANAPREIHVREPESVHD